MTENLFATLAVTSLALASAGCNYSIEPWTHGVVFDRVLVVVLENTDYVDAINDPYLHDLAARGALFSNFNGNFHPSYPNYLAMVAGDYFNTILDYQKDIDAPSIADLLESRELTWKNYAEGYPGNCFLGSTSGRFARKHVPFLSFTGIQNDPTRCANIVPAEQFATDVAQGTVPNYAFYSPNMDDDGHDTGLPTASAWLAGFVEPLLANPAFMERTLIEITFDESASYTHNHIYTLFLGPMVKAGYVETGRADHYNVLRTIEENFAVGTLGADDETANPIQSVWKDEAAARSMGRQRP